MFVFIILNTISLSKANNFKQEKDLLEWDCFWLLAAVVEILIIIDSIADYRMYQEDLVEDC